MLVSPASLAFLTDPCFFNVLKYSVTISGLLLKISKYLNDLSFSLKGKVFT